MGDDEPRISFNSMGKQDTSMILTLSGFLASRKLNILQSSQFGDVTTNSFFMRIHFLPTAEAAGTSEVESLRSEFDTIAKEHEMQWSLVQASEKPRTLIMV